MVDHSQIRPLYTLSYTPPYVKRPSWFSFNLQAPVETLEDQIRIKELTAYVLKWCEQRNYLQSIPDGYAPSISKNQSSFRYQIYAANMRRMVIQADLNEMLKIAADNDLEHIMTEFQQLCIQLSIFYETKLINLLINRIYRAYHMIPVPSAEMEWEDLHQDYPFFWIFLFVHTLLTFYTDPAPRVVDP